MKKRYFVLAIALVVALCGINSYAYPSYPGEIKNFVGQKPGEATRTYKFVRYGLVNPNAGSLSANEVVIYDTTSDDGVTIVKTTTSADGAIAGIVVETIQTAEAGSITSAADDAGRRNWGFIQVHGPAIAKVRGGGNTCLAKSPFVTSGDSGAVTSLECSTSTNAVSRPDLLKASHFGGFFMDNCAGTAVTETVDVFIRLE